MATLLEKVAEATLNRRQAEAEFRGALVAAREFHTWAELADITGLTINGVRYLVLEHTKGDKP